MGFEFDESEMYPCDICGEFWPMGEMHELEDGRIVYRNGKKVLILAGKAALYHLQRREPVRTRAHP